jgi:hypothetical protein
MRMLAVLLAVVAVAGCAPRTEPAAEAAVEEGLDDLSSWSLIELAVRQGRLDFGTGLLYKVYSVYDPTSLPEEFQSDAPAKCGTPVAVEVQRSWHLLTPEQRAEIELYIEPLQDDEEMGTPLDDVAPERPEHGRGDID